jgi:hypothetical protein
MNEKYARAEARLQAALKAIHDNPHGMSKEALGQAKRDAWEAFGWLDRIVASDAEVST